MLTNKIYRFSSLLLISLCVASAIYILFSSLYQIASGSPYESFLAFSIILFVVLFFLRKQTDFGTNQQSDFPTITLLILGVTLIFYRSTTYAFSFDDMVFHLPAGHYFGSVWLFKNFMPMNFPTFLYPLLQIPYSFLVDLLGLRAAILLLSTLQLFWFVSLAKRFALVIFPNDQAKRAIVSLLFFALYFIPELVATHVTFSSDFYSVLFALEVTYAWISKKNFGWMGLMMLMAIFAKQSSGLFLIPVFAYFVLSRLKTISLRQLVGVLPIVLSIAFYHLILFANTGNPLAFLLNGIFKSPLYPIDNFRDMRWGPVGLLEIFVWPAVGNLTMRFNELTSAFKTKYFALLFSLAYLGSAAAFIKTRKVIYLVLFASYVFWAWQSGYGRYHLAFLTIASVLLLQEFKRKIPEFENKVIFVFTGLVAVVALIAFRIDVGQRGFILEKYFPPKISPYYLNQFQNGLSLYGQDRFYDLYLSTAGETHGTKSIVVSARGQATFDAFLLNRYEGIAVYQKLSSEDKERILAHESISDRIKMNLESPEPSLFIDGD